MELNLRCMALQRQLEEQQGVMLDAHRSASQYMLDTNARLEAFNYMVSHELRAALRIVDGFVELLGEDLGSASSRQVQSDLQHLRTAVGRMQNMVQQLLALSVIEQHKFESVELDISSMAHEILSELQMVERQREVDIEVAAGLHAWGEPTLVRELLTNLLRNAWKFTSGRAHARIQVGSCFQDGQWVFYVRDNGIGFPMQQASELFKPFRRLSNAGAFEGTGIGLYTIRRIVERHGGRVWAVAAPERGAKICFTLCVPESVEMEQARAG
jgi:signal transduction histidine kinase